MAFSWALAIAKALGFRPPVFPRLRRSSMILAFSGAGRPSMAPTASIASCRHGSGQAIGHARQGGGAQGRRRTDGPGIHGNACDQLLALAIRHPIPVGGGQTKLNAPEALDFDGDRGGQEDAP